MRAAAIEPDLASEMTALFTALSHPTRCRVLLEIHAAGEALSPVELSRRLAGQSLGTVSYHVRQLVRRGMLELTGHLARRGAVEHFYSLTAAGELAIELTRSIGEGR